MHMDINEARTDCETGGIEHLGAIGPNVPPDGDDARTFAENIGKLGGRRGREDTVLNQQSTSHSPVTSCSVHGSEKRPFVHRTPGECLA
jgi:hypothetical protein